MTFYNDSGKSTACALGVLSALCALAVFGALSPDGRHKNEPYLTATLHDARKGMEQAHKELTQRLITKQGVVRSRFKDLVVDSVKDNASALVCFRREGQSVIMCNDGYVMN